VGINVEWRDESGKVIEQISDSNSLLYQALAAAQLEATQFLRFIDFYGDTTFNQLQLSGLLAEFSALAKSCAGERARHLLSITLLLVHASSTHTYVTFVGD